MLDEFSEARRGSKQESYPVVYKYKKMTYGPDLIDDSF
jgi:hypothetical protein